MKKRLYKLSFMIKRRKFKSYKIKLRGTSPMNRILERKIKYQKKNCSNLIGLYNKVQE